MDLKAIDEKYRAEISKLCESEYVYYAIIFLLVVITTYGLLGFMEMRIRKIISELKTEKHEEKIGEIRVRIKVLEGTVEKQVSEENKNT